MENDILVTLRNDLEKLKGLKWYLSVDVKFSKLNAKGESVENEIPFRTTVFTSTNTSQFSEQLAQGFKEMHNSAENFQKEGSGWHLDEVENLKIHRAVYQPLAGSSYVPLPKFIANKKAVINIQNDDQKCFLWSVIAFFSQC